MPCRFARAITGPRLLSLVACILFIAARMPAHAAPYENIRIDVNRTDKAFAGTKVLEVARDKEVVWQKALKGVAWTEEVKMAGAQRGKGPRGSGGGAKDQWL